MLLKQYFRKIHLVRYAIVHQFLVLVKMKFVTKIPMHGEATVIKIIVSHPRPHLIEQTGMCGQYLIIISG